MEELKTLIRNLAFILLLATFLELLLPGEKMKGFVRMVMGLFVIAAILTPIAHFLNLDYEDKVPAWVTVSSRDMPVMAPEGNSEDIGKSAVREQYRQILINQIQELVFAMDGVKDVSIDVKMDKSSGGFSDYPQILEVSVLFSSQSMAAAPIDPIIIGENKSNAPAAIGTDKERAVRKQIASFMQIPEELIIVQEK